MELESTRDDLLYEVFKISEDDENRDEKIAQSVSNVFVIILRIYTFGNFYNLILDAYLFISSFYLLAIIHVL